MNKRKFLLILRKELATLPEDELNELIEDYEAHFAFGLQGGKTEEDIANELGDPWKIARDIYEESGLQPLRLSKTVSASRSIFSMIGLFFLNVMFVIPIAVVIWSVCVALSVTALAGIISPFLALIEFIIYRSFSSMLFFTSITMCGVGILLTMAAIYLGKWLARFSFIYFKWNIRIAKGE